MWFVRTFWAARRAGARSRWPDGGAGARSSARGASRVAISNGHRSATPSVSTRQGYASPRDGGDDQPRWPRGSGVVLASEPTRDYVPEPELTVADRVALGHVLALTREDARQIARGNGDEPPPKNDETSAADSVFLLAATSEARSSSRSCASRPGSLPGLRDSRGSAPRSPASCMSTNPWRARRPPNTENRRREGNMLARLRNKTAYEAKGGRSLFLLERVRDVGSGGSARRSASRNRSDSHAVLQLFCARRAG